MMTTGEMIEVGALVMMLVSSVGLLIRENVSYHRFCKRMDAIERAEEYRAYSNRWKKLWEVITLEREEI